MTQEEVENLSLSDVEQNRKTIYLNSIKNENEFSNNNETSKCKQTEFDQSETKLVLIDEKLAQEKTSQTTKNKSDNLDIEDSKDSDSISTHDKGKHKNEDI